MTEMIDSNSAAQPVGVLVVTHGEFGAALLDAAQMILGPQQGIRSVSVQVARGVDEIIAELKAAALKAGMVGKRLGELQIPVVFNC